ncbi:RHS repeat protein [Chitinophaga sp. 22321]|uniref:RHS repeat protein n=1 Tax=Chitinophaga hostae TaxID=2831022 RepID=A0ABS5IWB0_9BACT|nr:RHS repeat protein [Chitinophaga hostae]MBS0027236.1 RHS repeat protein [Chitinophaga hostae]
MMKKLLVLFILVYGLGKAQIERNFGTTPDPVPSASSFASYSNTPISLATGVPEISVPLFTLPTSNKNLTIPLGLSNHVYNVGLKKPAGEVGLGWSLSKVGIISRVINNDVDEKYDNNSKPDYKKNIFDDLYYYNIPGSSGKFKFVRDTINNTFTLNNISGNNVKIDYTRTANTATLILESFKITDDKGFKYFYDNYSIASREGYKTNYRSAFYLSKILDENDIEIVNLAYQKDTRYSGTSTKYQSCNLTTVTTIFGKINFENIYEPYWENNGSSDPNKLQSVSLLDNSGRQVSKYKFEYGIISIPNNQAEEKRILTNLYKLDKDQNTIARYSFQYENSGSTPSQMIGALTEMKLPEGGRVVYQYDANEIYTAVSYPGADNYSIKYPEIQRYVYDQIFFDTNITRTYTFQVDEPRAIFIRKDDYVFYKNKYQLGIHDNPDTYNYQITYVVKKAGTVVTSNETPKYLLTPGTYTIEVNTGFGNGEFSIGRIETDPPPYRNAKTIATGARIRRIEYYDNNTLKKSINYKYDAFDNAWNSSGDYFTLETCQSQEYDYLNSVILYNNVKEIYGDSNNLGYSQYYFKRPTDFIGNGTRPHYNLVSGGLLYKKEVYNTQNQLVSSENIDYVLNEINNASEYTLCDGTTSKASWTRSAKTTSKAFFSDGSALENISEITYSPLNFEPVYTKVTAPDGKITETNIKYSSDLNNIKLVNARMLSTALETEMKINGKLVSKAETKYDNPSSLQVTSINSYEMQNQSAQTKVIFSNYDSYGNPVETKTPKGIPTAVIYGYNNTKPIAKIEGSSYAQIISLPAVQNAITASNSATPENESDLKTALENLRISSFLKEFNVSTYTWDVLTGMTSITTPNGSKEMYTYDKAGRLEKVVDQNGKTLKTYQYNYKQ